MTLKVIGAGFGRTGTLSLKLALEQLGFGPCYHLYEIREHPSFLAPWMAALGGQTPDWSKVFEGYVSQVDWPAAVYWKELHAAFPEAKVILTLRNPVAWFDSLQATIVPSVTIGSEYGDSEHARAVSEMVYRLIYKGLFKDRMTDRDFVLKVWQDHVDEVRRTVPPEQLLEFDVRQGWGPLCDFLGVPVPEAPFPRTNSTEDFLDRKPYLRERLAGAAKPG
ncbi:sulfotransferase family protein [Tabrizicola soli]|uniref:Sulfotransferase family protein n=1 Tax=Tabrizicola soli TaxID=2185115 RepID=A0ABV7DZZ2_9RHOB|nr:sulfotransferase family protein [Tabrizicola soli]